MKEYKDLLFNSYNIDENLESELHEKFDALSLISEYNQVKILKAMQDNRLAATDFNWTTGYGYGDIGREKVESIFSNIFNL